VIEDFLRRVESSGAVRSDIHLAKRILCQRHYSHEFAGDYWRIHQRGQ